MNGCQTKSICLRTMTFHPKQQYTLLFQWNFISEVYLLQEKSYLTFYTGRNFWRALYSKKCGNHLCRFFIIYCFTGNVWADRCTHRHYNRLHFCLGCLFKGVSYDLLQWDERHEIPPWEKGLKDFLDLLIFYLILGLNPHTHTSFFSSPAALAGPESGIFKFFKKLLFLPFFTIPH